jgi:hypothetical protein
MDGGRNLSGTAEINMNLGPYVGTVVISDGVDATSSGSTSRRSILMAIRTPC